MITFLSTDDSQSPEFCKSQIYKLILLITIFLFMASVTICQTNDKETLIKSDFSNPPASVKIHTWWHWVSGAITKDGITKDLESISRQGISQATILNVGLFEGRDLGVPRVVFNSPQWNEMFRWALKEANRLGISIGAQNCDGWSTSGGPWITPEMSMKQFVWTKTIIEGGKSVVTKLDQPFSRSDFYRDVAVVAYKATSGNNSYQLANPRVTINDSINTGRVLSDGNPVSGISMREGDYVQINFDNEFSVNRIVIYPRRPFMWRDMTSFKSRYKLLVSTDGKNYRCEKELEIAGLNKISVFPIPDLKSRFYRLQLTGYSDVDAEFGFNLSEVELLGSRDQPTFLETIPNLLEKTVCIKTLDKSIFDGLETFPVQNFIENESSVIELTKNLSADGTLNWNAPAGNWSIIRFGYTTTGSMNAPATKEGVGLECDKMDTTALGIHFRSYPQKLINQASKYAGNTFKFFLIDSWECGYQNWTTNFASEFERLHGYTIINWIPVLCGETIGNTQLSEGFLYDFRKTIAMLIEKNYYKYFGQLCHSQKIELHSEVIYGDAVLPPIDVLKANTYADVPMFEFWAGPPPAKVFPEPYVPQPRIKGNLPAYAANCYRLPILAAEAYTSWAHYSESPFYLKPFGDRAFCAGINQLILHSYVHQPTDKLPGIMLGRFGSHFNRHNTWWSMTSDWFDYQNRIQYLLQKGETVSDVLYFLGDQFPQFPANSIVDKLSGGFRANGCNSDVLLNRIEVKEGKLELSPGQSYSILILPDSRTIEFRTLRRIEEIVSQGATVYGRKPLTPLSLKGKREELSAFHDLANKLWGSLEDAPFGSKKTGRGKIVWGAPIEKVLQELKLSPDLETNQQDSLNIQFIHKKIGQTDIYFVANQQNMALKRELVFRISDKIPEIWNPQNGTILKPVNYSNVNSRVQIPVAFGPYESLVFVFEGKDTPHQISDVKPPESLFYQISNFKGTIAFSPTYPAIIPTVQITDLKSWTEFSDPAIKYFSGKASYTIHFKLPDNISLGSDSILLNLGEIKSVGGVRLNNHWLGNIWLPDFRINVSGILKPDNILEVEVANVYRNRIIGDLIEFGKLQNVWTTSPLERYFDKDKPLMLSGLLGPMQLIKLKKK